MRRKKAARKAGPSKPLSAHEAGKVSPHRARDPAAAARSVKYDDEAIYKPLVPLTVKTHSVIERREAGLGELEDVEDLLPRYPGEPFEELVQRRAIFEILEQRLYRDPRSAKHPGPA